MNSDLYTQSELFHLSRKQVLDYAKTNILGKKVFRKELGTNIEFTKRGIKEALSQPHDYYLEKNELVKNIVAILETAPYKEPPVKNKKAGKKSHVLKYHYFSLLVKNVPSQIVVEEDKYGKFTFYSISREYIEKAG